MAKGKVPPQLKGHAFGKGTAKAAKVGAKGGRKSPDMVDGGTETSATTKRTAAPKGKADTKPTAKAAPKAKAARTAKPKAKPKAPTKRT